MGVRVPHMVRPAVPEDVPFMREMLYEAAHHRPLSDPNISRYLDGWRRPGDDAMVALAPEGGRNIGAAWYRLMPAQDPGYGFVDALTPEVVIAVVPEYRGVGVGGALLRGLMQVARTRGHGALSLSVRRENQTAVRLYEGNGFMRVGDAGSGEYPSWTMRAEVSAKDENQHLRRTHD